MKYEKVFIKSESDLPKEDNIYFTWLKDLGIVGQLVGSTTLMFREHRDKKMWLESVDWYLQPLPEQTESAEEFIVFKLKYTINEKLWSNILKDHSAIVFEIEQWLKEYASQPSEVSDEDIEEWAESNDAVKEMNKLSPSQWCGFAAKAMRDGKITHKQQ